MFFTWSAAFLVHFVLLITSWTLEQHASALRHNWTELPKQQWGLVGCCLIQEQLLGILVSVAWFSNLNEMVQRWLVVAVQWIIRFEMTDWLYLELFLMEPSHDSTSFHSLSLLVEISVKTELYNVECSHIRLSWCNSSDPFIVKCSQRPVLETKTFCLCYWVNWRIQN